MTNHSCAAVLCLLALNAWADAPQRSIHGTQQTYQSTLQKPVRGLIGVVFGWDWAQVGVNQDILLLSTDPAPDFFRKDSTTSSQPMAGINLGLEFPAPFMDGLWQTNVAYYWTNTFETSGVDYFYSLPTYGDRAYTYSINSQRVMLENTFLLPLGAFLLPNQMVYGYVMLGLGVAFNSASNYSETPLDPNTPADGVFSDHSNASPSFSAGVGFESELTSAFRVNVGYRFSDIGTVSLGDYNNGDTDESLSTENTFVQEAIIQFVALF